MGTPYCLRITAVLHFRCRCSYAGKRQHGKSKLCSSCDCSEQGLSEVELIEHSQERCPGVLSTAGMGLRGPSQPTAADGCHGPICGVSYWWFGVSPLKMLITKTRFDSQIAPNSSKAYKSSTPVFAHSCCSALPWEGRCLFHSSAVIYNGIFGWRWSTYLSNGDRAVNLILLISSHQLNGKQ